MRTASLFFLLFFSTPVFSNDNCTKDNEFCFYNVSLDRNEANKFCQDKDAKLASIENKGKETKILSILPKGNRYWTGGKYIKNNSSYWHWEAGSEFTYANWGKGEPNNLEKGESYLLLDLTEEKAFWNDNRNNGHTQKKEGIYVICQDVKTISINIKKSSLIESNNYNYDYFFNVSLYFLLLFPLFLLLMWLFTREKPVNHSFHNIEKEDIGLTRLAERKIHINKEILIILSWDNKNDLDLHVLCPNGDEISYKTLGHYICGGMLDVDANASNLRNDPIEKIGWDQYPTVNGCYKIFVNYYAYYDPYEIKTKFQVETIIFGKKDKFTGFILPKDKMVKISEFTINQ
jgi:hypothetical protein